MAKLNSRDIAAIKDKFLEGQGTDIIAAQFDISGQYARKLSAENGWANLRDNTLSVEGMDIQKVPSNTVLTLAKIRRIMVREQNLRGPQL